jgi:hypothetical protein
MEDVLEVYQRPHDPAFPVVCVDETSKQLIGETRVPIAAKPGHPARHDYEYERNSLPPRRRYGIHTSRSGWRIFNGTKTKKRVIRVTLRFGHDIGAVGGMNP